MANESFFRVNINDNTFIRGAARLMYADMSQAFPTDLSQIINLSNFNALAGWSDLGATKTGVQIIVNNTEETFQVDQITTDIDSRPTGWQYAIATALAEVDPTHMAFAWEGSTVATVGREQQVGFGEPHKYTRRRLAILQQKDNDLLRGAIFRKCQRAPQESTLQHAPTGEQQTIPVRFGAYADTSIPDVKQRTFMVFDEVT